MYNSVVKSILFFGAKGWRIMEAERMKLGTVEMDALRGSCRDSRIERIRNERIKDVVVIIVTSIHYVRYVIIATSIHHVKHVLLLQLLECFVLFLCRDFP